MAIKRGERRVYMTTRQHLHLASAVAKAARVRASYDAVAQELVRLGLCPLMMAPLPVEGKKSRLRIITEEQFQHMLVNFPKQIEAEYKAAYGA
jgi:hypothetical protein